MRPWPLILIFLAGCPTTDTDTDPDTDTDSDSDTDSRGLSGVLLSALIADNETHAQDEAGEFDDYVELTNYGSEAVPLLGYAIGDDYPTEVPWPLPDITLGVGATLRLWCDDTAEQGELHTDFRLSKDGETVTLIDPDGVVADEVTFPALNADEVYARTGDDWAVRP